jgi:hypothetical protein
MPATSDSPFDVARPAHRLDFCAGTPRRYKMLKNLVRSKLEIALYLGAAGEENASAFSAPATSARADRPRAESLWKYECPGFIFIRAPTTVDPPASLSPRHSPCRENARGWIPPRLPRAFPSGKYSAFWCSKPLFAPTANDITGIGVIRRIPTRISTSPFTTFDPSRSAGVCYATLTLARVTVAPVESPKREGCEFPRTPSIFRPALTWPIK